jgi:hypothetical protein
MKWPHFLFPYIFVILLVTAGTAAAADLSGIHDFLPNTPARAASVNNNFDLLSGALTEARTGALSIPGGAFAPADTANAYWLNGRGEIISNASGTQTFFAPVNLPQGAEVLDIKSYWYDDSASADLLVTMVKCEYADTDATACTGMADISSAGSPGESNMLTDVITDAFIDNTANYYHIRLETGAVDHLLAGVVIRYSYTLN